MGAFVLFPVLLFSIFITSVLGVFDYIHVAILVHAAAQTAVTAAAQDVSALNTQGNYQLLSTQSAADATAANAVVAGLLTGKPYITSWSCSATTNSYACSVNFKVPMPILGSVSATTSATGTYATNVQTTNTSSPSSGPNLPIFGAGTTTLNPGWSLQQTGWPHVVFINPAGLGGTSVSDGASAVPASGASVSYSFKVPAAQSTTITYGVPLGGSVNTHDPGYPPGAVYVNGTPQTPLDTGIGYYGSQTTDQENLWSETFGPGAYVVKITGTYNGDVNIYGLWASNPSAVIPD